MASPMLPKRPLRWTQWLGYHWQSAFLSLRPPESGSAVTRFSLELFLILALSVCYYFLVRNFAVGVGDNQMNTWVYSACAKSAYHLDTIPDVWKGRLPGLLLSGSMFDWVVDGDSYPIAQYAMLFGLYQAFWLLMLLLTILVAARQSLLINLCIFAGLLYNFIPLANFYFFPWDLPATVFMTLAVLLFDRGHRGLMLAAICVGCLFKETVLVAAILCFFCRDWRWRWRILSFVGLAAFYLLSKRYLVSALHLKAAVLSMGDATNLQQLLRLDILIPNLKLLFSAKAPQVLFANAGTLVAVLVVGWQKRFRPFMWVILLFVAGQFMYGTFNEVRIFMQVLPLCCLILSEYVQSWATQLADAASLSQCGDAADQPTATEGGRKIAPSQVIAAERPSRGEGLLPRGNRDFGLILITAVLMVGTSALVVWDYHALLQALNPKDQAQQIPELRTRALRGEAEAQYALGNRYYRGHGVELSSQEAIHWYRKAAGKGHVGAQLTLGLCCLRGENTVQSYEESIRLFRKVAARGNQAGRCYPCLDYKRELGLDREMASHFQYLARVGPVALVTAGLSTMVGFICKRKLTADPAIIVAAMLATGALCWGWKYGGVEPVWQSTVACDPNYFLACENLGYALAITGELDGAINCFQKTTELQPRNPDAHYSLGSVYYKRGKLDEAIHHFRKVVELRPEDAMAHNSLGGGLHRKGKLDEAIHHYHEALRLKPNFPEAKDNLVDALLLKRAAAKEQGPATIQ